MSLSEDILRSTNHYSLNGAHRAKIADIAIAWSNEAQERFAILGPMLRPSRPTIQLRVLDDPSFYADFLPFAADQEHPPCWILRVSMGIFSRTLGVVNRVLANYQPWLALYSFTEEHESWDETEASTGMLTVSHDGKLEAHCDRVVKDIAHLAALHELAHAMEGHAPPDAQDPARTKALEAAADLGAGELFMHLIRMEHVGQERVPIQPAIERLVDASFFLTTLVYRSAPESLLYHHPNTRWQCFMQGAYAASQLSLAQWSTVLEHAQTTRVQRYAMALRYNDFDDRYAFWINHPIIQDDLRDYYTNTVERITQERSSARTAGVFHSIEGL